MGFDTYPALAIRQPDLGKTLITAAYLKSSKLKNQLTQAKLKRLKLVQGLGGNVMGVGGGADVGGESGDQLAGDAGVSEGGASPMINPASEAMRALMAIDPEVGGQYVTAIKNMNEETRKQKKNQNATITRLLIAVEDMPEGLQRQQAYTQAREKARQMGMDITNVPEKYDSRYVHQKIKFGMAIDDEIGAVERTAAAEGVWVQGPKGKTWMRKDRLEGVTALDAPPTGYRGAGGGNLESIPGGPADPKVVQALGEAKADADTGPMKDAVALGLKPGSKQYNDYISARTLRKGMSIEFDEEGRISSISTGGSQGKSGLTPATTTDIQKKLVGINEGYARLQEIASTFKPEYQEIGTRWDALLTSWKAKLQGAGSVDPADRKLLTEFSDFKRTSVSGFNLYVKSITGAQVSEHEAKRLQQGFPNPGTGLVDGDDPITFKSKLDSTMRELALAKARHQYYLTKGITDVNVMAKQTPMDSMEVLVNPQTGERIVQIENEWVPL